MRRRYHQNNLQDLFSSVSNGSLEGLNAYIRNGGNINLSNDQGTTLLHKAVIENHGEKVGLLIKHGCCINMPDDQGCTAIHLAIKKDHTSILDTLLSHKAHVNTVSYKHTTPLIHAVQVNNKTAVQLILEKGHQCDVNVENYYQQSALVQAVMCNNAPICQILLQHGASVKSIYNKNFTTEIARYLCRNKDLMRIFLQYGQDLNLYYHLMMACILKEMSVAEMVLCQYDRPFQLKGLGFIMKQESDHVWEELAKCVVKPYRYATKCSQKNELLTLILGFCDNERIEQQRRNHQQRAKIMLRILVRYGMVINWCTSVKNCAEQCECRKCIFASLYGLDPVTSLKGQCCSVIRQSLRGSGDKIDLESVTILPIPSILKEFICMADW